MKTKIARLFAIIAAIGALGFGAYQLRGMFSGEDIASEAATYSVVRRTVDDRAVERGTVESQKTVYGKCELNGRNKIVFIVPEGTEVKEGDRVAEFERTETQQDIDQKKVEINEAITKLDEAKQAIKIQSNKNQQEIDSAKTEYELAVLDLQKYKEGDFVAEKADLERAIKEAEAELEKVRDEKKGIELLVRKGFRSAQQLREYELMENKTEFALIRDRQKLRVLIDYDLKRKLTELRAKVEDSRRKVERAEDTAKAEMAKAEAAVSNAENGLNILKEQLKELEAQLEKCVLKAEQDGIVAYANERWYSSSDRIREGTELWNGADVYYLPDMSRMQVKANVHESVVDRIKEGQKASIRLDAFSDRKLTGTVKSVANMAASTYTAIQRYETIVLIDELPEDLAIKPGMTAEVDILVGRYEDVIAVPVNAITEHFEQSYVYVVDGSDVERRRVETGRMTHSFVEITEGLEEGEQVALDAYQRGLEDFADKQRDGDAAEPNGTEPAAS